MGADRWEVSGAVVAVVLTPRVLVVDRDDALANQVTKALASSRPRPEVVACTVATVGEVLASNGPFDVLIAGPTLIAEPGLARIRRLRVEHPSVSIVMAANRRPDASFRDIVRAGAVDVLQLPVPEKELAEAVGEAAAIARGAQAGRAETPRAEQPATSTVITVLSASGGSGKTFLATNIAYYLHTRLHQRVCIVDLDLQFGELPTALRLRPRYTMVDALHREDGEDIATHIEDYVTAHDTGIFVMAGPSDPIEADMIASPDVAQVVAALRARFDVVVIDTPAMLNETVLIAVELSDQIVAVATLDLPSVRNMSVLLATLRQLKVPDENIDLVLNKVETDVGIDVEEVTKHFPQGLSIVIPYGKEVSKSLNMGVPMLAYLPAADVSKALYQGLPKVVPGGPEAGDAPKDGRGRRRRRRKERSKV